MDTEVPTPKKRKDRKQSARGKLAYPALVEKYGPNYMSELAKKMHAKKRAAKKGK